MNMRLKKQLCLFATLFIVTVTLTGCGTKKLPSSGSPAPESSLAGSETESPETGPSESETQATETNDTETKAAEPVMREMDLHGEKQSLTPVPDGDAQITALCPGQSLLGGEYNAKNHYRLVGFDETTVYCTVFSDDSAALTCLKIDRGTLRTQSILCDEEFSYILDTAVINGSFYLVSAAMTEETLPWEIRIDRIDSSGKCYTRFSERTLTIPQVWHNDSLFYLTADSKDFTTISYAEQVNPAQTFNNSSTVSRIGYTPSDDGTISGTYLLSSGGDNQTVYVESAQLKNMRPEDQPDVRISRYRPYESGGFYDFTEDLGLSCKNGLSGYLSGNDDYLFLSLHQEDLSDVQSGENTGVLIDLDSLGLWEIPGTSAGQEIDHAAWLDNGTVLFRNYPAYLLVNLEKKEVLTWDNPGNGIAVSPEKTIGWLEDTGTEVLFHELNTETLNW